MNEDAGPPERFPDYELPSPDSAEYDMAAARALLDGARAGDTIGAEEATGCKWGESRLASHVRQLLEKARNDGDDRLEQLAERYLRAAASHD